jgi:F-box and WD-40 domain protein CDC4
MTRYCDKTPRRDDRKGGQALSGPVHSVVSISEAAKLAGTNSSSRKRRHSRSTQTASDQPGAMAQNHALTKLQTCQLSTPLTPSLDAPIKSAFGVYGARRSKRLPKLPQRQTRNSPRLDHRRMSSLASPQQDDEEEDLSQTNIEPPVSSSQEEPHTSQESQGNMSTNSFSSDPGCSNTGLAISAPFARPRPAALDTAAAQDISLPSPRLSPVTALANLQNRRGYFDDDHVQIPSGRLALSSPPHEEVEDDEMPENVLSGSSLWHQERPIKREYQDTPSPSSLNQHEQPSTLMDMSSILDTFESMPQDMQTYLMYQLLRRCPKPILHFVADTVEPALKCDFLSLLPRELSQMVIGHLDVRSLCRASQVSKKWRQVIDTDEQTWKRLLDAQGFVSSLGELQRAIREGWGWQHISRVDDWERDFSEQDSNLNDESWDLSPKGEMPTSPTPTSDLQVQSTQVKRSKRKAAAKSKLGGRKQQKRRDTNSALMAQFDYEAMTKHSIPDGPSAAREAAAIAVPFGKDGLPSLRQLHLYKSIYRRHHIIRSSWMQDEVKPRHIAFQAHDRFVVTCLQFDTDKILTGSDDTNINVYDTKTGQLRARLEGHEGGVWALQYQGNVLVSGSTDRSVRIWDIKRGVCTHIFQGHTSTVRCLVILMPTVIDTAPDGEPIKMPKEPLIITGSRDSSLRVWRLPKEGDSPWTDPTQDDTDCPYFVRALTGHHHSVRAIAAHGDTLVSGSYDCSVRVWKISTGEVVHRLQGHTQKVYSVVLDHERNRCISGSMDNMVKVWSLDSGLCLFNLEGHSSLVGLLDLQRDRLVSAAADSTLRVWDPENGRCQSTLSAHTGAITCFQHDGQKVISGSDRTLKMWDVRTGQFVRDLLTDLSGVWQVKFDERRCVAAVQRSNLTYIEVSFPHTLLIRILVSPFPFTYSSTFSFTLSLPLPHLCLHLNPSTTSPLPISMMVLKLTWFRYSTSALLETESQPRSAANASYSLRMAWNLTKRTTDHRNRNTPLI